LPTRRLQRKVFTCRFSTASKVFSHSLSLLIKIALHTAKSSIGKYAASEIRNHKQDHYARYQVPDHRPPFPCVLAATAIMAQ
jgi:hypothetical protein